MQSSEQRELLGAFVRARREGLPPEEPGRRRRTPGLRREELAAQAGIGVTWVAWIEQGREVRPSADTLARLAGALRLTDAERAYLFTLAGRADPDNPFSGPFAPEDGDAPASIVALVRAVKHPAYGLDPAWNICAANAAARRLFIGLFNDSGHRNLLRYVFTDPAARTLLPDWEQRVARLLAEFRRDYGRNLADPRAHAVVDWLATESDVFRAAWERQAVSGREGGLRLFDHPEDGLLSFEQHTLCAADRPDFKLVMLEPLPKG
ncbi:MAG TPA: helix-turn-helix transcriptional regulator [Sphingobium sp.]|uniref:helix-turn-helix transcriptional regulator n=1 Tax=Sphingobium sp. TaxID=1912891 RepID=UPI002ED4AB7D